MIHTNIKGAGMNKKGFSLIELIIVVLIIGILVAVALPLYFKAMEKTRATEAIAVMKHFKDLKSIYDQSSSDAGFFTSLTKFGSAYPGLTPLKDNAGGLSAFPDGAARLNNFDYVVTTDMHPLLYSNIVAIRNSGSYKGYALFSADNKNYCMENADVNSKEICNDMFGGEPAGVSGPWTIYSLPN